jgi:hypothetical protein
VANPRGNPNFGKTIKGRPPKKPEPPVQTDGSIVKRVEAKIDQHLDDLLDVVISHALRNKNAQSALALLERRLGPTSKVQVERDDKLTDLLTELKQALGPLQPAADGLGVDSKLSTDAGSAETTFVEIEDSVN